MAISGYDAYRFWTKVAVGSPEQCWPWTDEVNNKGYGQFRTWRGGMARFLAHRVAYELHAGESIDRRAVMHSCDNPPCCNPHHLKLGTQLENIADMHAKGRNVDPPHSIGSHNSQAKLDETNVAEILRLLGEGVSQSALGRQFRVSASAIRSIAIGRTWKHVRPAVDDVDPSPEQVSA